MKMESKRQSDAEDNRSIIANVRDNLPSIFTPTSHRGVNTVIAVALLTLVAVGFIVGFQQIGSDFLNSIQSPVSGTVSTSPQAGSVTLTLEDMSSNVDEVRIASNGGSVDGNFSISGTPTGSDFHEFDIGATAEVTGLDTGDTVTVTARDNPDNTQNILTYEHP